MGFNSIQYGLFLAAVFFLYWTLDGPSRRSLRLWFLLVVSYYFYANWDWRYLALIMSATGINFFAGLGIARLREANRPGSKALVSVAVVASLGLLAVFKYYNFFVANLNVALPVVGYAHSIPLSSLLLPVGISFYTFQSMSYTVDVYRGQIPASRSLRDFALYVAFFPQLVAGPIVRAGVLLPQFKTDPVFDAAQVSRGLYQVLCGLFKKMVIADLLANFYIDKVFAHPEQASLPLTWLAMWGYGMQIYCDFSGYSDVAIGSARMLGIEIPVNFNRPFLARDLREFWQRWHISFSTWLRDYVYFSLGGSRQGRTRIYLTLFLTMVLGGFWHGASWTMVAWGVFHGVLFAASRMNRDRKPGRPQAPDSTLVTVLKITLTSQLFFLSAAFFRATSIHDSWTLIQGLVLAPITLQDLPIKALPFLALGFILHWTPPRWRDELGNWFVRAPWFAQGAILAAMLALLSLVKDISSPFIYFQF